MVPFCVRCLSHRNAKCFKSQFKNVKKHGKGGIKHMQAKREKLRAEMEGINAEQLNIREEQRRVREKFEGIVNECEELKRETRIIIQQTANTQMKLALMFQIVKASKQNDHAIVATLTHLLRYMFMSP